MMTVHSSIESCNVVQALWSALVRIPVPVSRVRWMRSLCIDLGGFNHDPFQRLLRRDLAVHCAGIEWTHTRRRNTHHTVNQSNSKSTAARCSMSIKNSQRSLRSHRLTPPSAVHTPAKKEPNNLVSHCLSAFSPPSQRSLYVDIATLFLLPSLLLVRHSIKAVRGTSGETARQREAAL